MNLRAVSRPLLTSENDNYLILPLLLAVLEGAFLADAKTLAVTVFTFGLFVLPGFVICRSFTTSTARAISYGLPLGYSLTSLLIIALVGTRGWDMRTIALGYLLGIGVLWAVTSARPASSATRVPTADVESQIRLPAIVALGLAFTLIALYVPLDHDGRLTLRGYAFTGLFGHDFNLRAVDSMALANAIPSDNYFFNGVKTYNYYVLWYILPATIYNLLGKQPALTDIISILNLLYVPIFGTLVYYALARFVRATTDTPVASFRLGVIFVLLFVYCYSYHWLFFLVAKLPDVAAVPLLAHLSTLMGPVSTSWFKDFLFQPHCVLGLMQLLAMMHFALTDGIRARGLWLGILGGSLLLTDFLIFLVATTGFGFWYVSRKSAWGSVRKFVPEFLALAAAALAVVALAFYLKIFIIPEYSNKAILSPNWSAIAGLPALLLICLGPLPVLALLALRQKTWVFTEQLRLLLLVTAASLFFMLFVNDVIEGNVFLRKSLMALRLPLLIFSAAYLYAAWSRLPRLLILLLALAVPTLFTDWFATSQTDDARYTTYVTPDEMSAASWLRLHTKTDAVVQSLIEYEGAFEYSLTVCYGERKAPLGLWQMAFQRYPNRDAITFRVHQIQTLFSASDADERANVVRSLHIDYVLIGPREEARFPGAGARFAADSLHFEQVYSSGTVRIYRARI